MTALPPIPGTRGPAVAKRLRAKLGLIDALIDAQTAAAEALESAFTVAFARHDEKSVTEQRISDLARPPRRKQGL